MPPRFLLPPRGAEGFPLTYLFCVPSARWCVAYSPSWSQTLPPRGFFLPFVARRLMAFWRTGWQLGHLLHNFRSSTVSRVADETLSSELLLSARLRPVKLTTTSKHSDNKLSTKHSHVAITDVTAPRRNSAQTSEEIEGPRFVDIAFKWLHKEKHSHMKLHIWAKVVFFTCTCF